MPELPWEKWYPTNWASEPGLRLCEAATRGIWFEAVNTMMLKQTDHVSGTVEQLAALCVCRVPQMHLAIEQLKSFDVADVTMQNECITLTNRRRKRGSKIREIRSNAAKSRWNNSCKLDANAPESAHARSASASAYASAFNSLTCSAICIAWLSLSALTLNGYVLFFKQLPKIKYLMILS